jgi:threonine aldolase
MVRFDCDYAEGAHDRILEKLVETNYVQTAGYGDDIHTENAKRYIKDLCGNNDVDVHLMVGGTQTNLTVISSILRPHQGVVSAETGHINIHETGAIEATGHKVISVHTKDGKLSADMVRAVYDNHWNDPTHEHIVQPGMVYISHPSENGTTYTKGELAALSKTCKECGLPLYMDGARLGYGLASEKNDLNISDIAELCDAFYIGGTKVGALFGEAIVISTPAFKKDFRYFIKQKGGLLAKGRLLGIQFEELFRDELYIEIAKHAVDMALMIKAEFERYGYEFLYDSVTNQQFPIIPNTIIERLQEKYAFYVWEKVDEENSAVRFCTSWATKSENVMELIEDIRKFHESFR